MNRNTLIAFGAAFALGALTVVALQADEAQAANVNMTLLQSGSEVVSLSFFPQPDGTVPSRVCGHAPFADGGFEDVRCFEINLPTGHAIALDVKALAAGQALTFWQQKRGM
jgi:hypothetical protein